MRKTVKQLYQVIIVGVALGWITGLNKKQDVDDAADLVKWGVRDGGVV